MSDFFSDIPDAPKPRFDRTSPGGNFGAPRPYGGHTGADFAWAEGERVGVPKPGKVRFAGQTKGYGNRVEVAHDDGTVTTYSHLSRIDVNKDDDLDGGSLVGAVGHTGHSHGNHLHYEVKKGGKKVNPLGTDYVPVRGAQSVKFRSGFFSDVPDAPQKADSFFDDVPNVQPPTPTPPSNDEAVGVSPTPRGAAAPAITARPPHTIEPGNIDLTKRPVVKNPDGSISTVRSISVNMDGREVLIPTVSDDGKVLTDEQAVDLYKRTGKHLGIFDSPEAATAYAQTLHEQQAEMYGGQKQAVTSRVLTSEEEEAALNPPLAEPKLKPYDPDAGLSAPAAMAQAANRMTQRPVEYDEGILEPVSVSIPMRGINAPGDQDVRGEKPAASEVVDALMEKLGPGWMELGRRYREETGREPIDPAHIPEPGVSVVPGQGYTPLPGREWNYTISPTRDFIDTMKAYQGGGLVEASRVATERANANVSARNKAAQDKPYLGNPASMLVSPLAVLADSQVGDDVVKGLGKTMQGTAQLAENLRKIHEGEAFGDSNQEKIDEARASMPGYKTGLGEVLGTGLEVGGDIARMHAIPGVGPAVEQFFEHYNHGGYEAAKAAGTIRVLEAVGVGGDKISKLLELSPVERQVFVRALQGDVNAAQAAAQGEKGAALLKSFGIGAAFPVGRGGRVEREPVAPRIAPTERTARQSYLDIPVTTPEGVRVRKGAQSPVVPPVPAGHTRFYRADRSDAAGPQGSGWARDPEYVSQKYGAGQMGGSESVWYTDVPDKPFLDDVGHIPAVTSTKALKTLGIEPEPKLFRRTVSPQAETGASEAAPGENLPVEGQQASNGPVVEPTHHSQIQPRNESSGQFRKVTTKDLREARNGLGRSGAGDVAEVGERVASTDAGGGVARSAQVGGDGLLGIEGENLSPPAANQPTAPLGERGGRGGSQVGLLTHADGTPREFYHGTNQVFDGFDINARRGEGDFGAGIYFTDSRGRADVEAGSRSGGTPNVRKAHLGMSNPLDMRAVTGEQARAIADAIAETGRLVDAQKLGRDLAMLSSGDWTDEGKAFEVIRRASGGAEVTEVLRRAGFDGVIAPASGEYVVFDPSQIRRVGGREAREAREGDVGTSNPTPADNPFVTSDFDGDQRAAIRRYRDAGLSPEEAAAKLSAEKRKAQEAINAAIAVGDVVKDRDGNFYVKTGDHEWRGVHPRTGLEAIDPETGARSASSTSRPDAGIQSSMVGGERLGTYDEVFPPEMRRQAAERWNTENKHLYGNMDGRAEVQLSREAVPEGVNTPREPWQMTRVQYSWADRPNRFYHQTTPEGAQAIGAGGFRLDAGRARITDNEMPDAVFVKPDSRRIALRGEVQLPVEADLGSVREFKDRADLTSFLSRDPEYKRLRAESEAVNRQAAAAMKDFTRDDFDDIAAEWQPRMEQAATMARERATAYLKGQGVDTIRVKADAGGLSGTPVETVAILDPARVAGDFHRQAVKHALTEGKPVPAEVLADYPDLQPKATTPDPSTLRDSFRAGMVKHLKLPEHQAESLTIVHDALDEGLTKNGWDMPRGSHMGQLAGIESGKGEGAELNQAADSAPLSQADPVKPRNVERVADTEEFTNLDEDDGYYYHVTSSDRVDSIMRDGIRPGARSIMGGGGYAGHSADKVFLTERGGVSFWKDRAEEHLFDRYDDPPDVVVLRVPKSAVKAVTLDEAGTRDARRPAYATRETLRQSNRAATTFLKDGRAVIRALDNPNVSTGLHEVHHVFTPVLAKATLHTPNAELRATGEAFFRWLGFDGARHFLDLHEGWIDGRLKDADRTLYVDGQEKGSRGFERYFKTGKAPSEKLAKVFADFKEWLTNIYGAIRGKSHPLNGKLSEEAIRAWDSVLGAPKGEHGQTTHELFKGFFQHPEVREKLGLGDEATLDDARWAFARKLGVPRSSHVSPQMLYRWAKAEGLSEGAVREIDYATLRAIGREKDAPESVNPSPAQPDSEPVAPIDNLIDSNTKLLEDFYGGRVGDAEFIKAAKQAGVSRAEVRAILADARDYRKSTGDSGKSSQSGGGGAVQGGRGAGRDGEGDVNVLYQAANPLSPAPPLTPAQRARAAARAATQKTPWYDVLTAFRRANLLSAPKTHARNITSNAAMMGSEEASKPFAALADAFIARQTGRRTVAAPSIASVARSVKDATVKGVPEALNVIRYGNPHGSGQQLDEVRSGSKILDTYINGVFRTLEAEDRVFKTYAVRRSLEEQAKVQAMNEQRADKGVNIGQRQKELLANPTPAMQAEAVAYAEFATFQNKNAISDTISKLKGKSELGKFAFEQLVPFDKTPTNIMLRVLDYSPAGLAKAGIQYGRAKKRAAQNVTSFMSPAEQKQFAQTFGRGTLGTGVLALGALLASKGLLAGDVDYKDDQKEYSERRRLGILPGSVRIGDKRLVVSGNPLGNILKLGATIYEQASRPVPKAAIKEGRALDVRATRGAKAAASVVSDQPFLRAAMEYAGSDKSLGQRFAEFAGGYVPAAAAVNEAGEVLDPKQRKAVGFTQTLQKRVPGFRNLLREQENPLGGKEGKGGFSRRFVRAFDPLQVTTQKGKQKRRK